MANEDLISGKEYQVTNVEDPTWRTYSTSASGRAISSIYHPATKRASRMASFMEKSNITNESLYMYITTESVQELNLERCAALSNKILKCIGEFCPRLTTLNLQHCTQVKDSTVRIITNGCPDLTYVNLGLCHLITDDALSHIFSHCKGLRVLSVHSCERIEGRSFSDIKASGKLEVLDVGYCVNLADWCLQYVSEYCPELIHLDVSGCPKIGDDGLCSIVQHCTKLETLRCMLCDQADVTTRSLGVLTKFATNLKVLELTGIRQLTDKCLEGIAKHGGNLEFISLSGCVLITDASIALIEENCNNLRCIELCSCRLLSVQPILNLIHAVKKLKKVVVSDCNISESELSILKSYTQRCTIVKHGIPAPPQNEFVCFQVKKATAKKKKKVVKKKK
ncbi:hypothetical protein AKO1_006487 [Acrasis kona]